MSKREEDFIEAGIQYRFVHGTPMTIGGGNFAEMTKEMNRAKPFEAGAETATSMPLRMLVSGLKPIYYTQKLTDI